jgi:uncharacterized damage-inducible protein DinB
MYRTIHDFLNDWKYENEATLKVFKNLTDASLNQKVTPDGRSLGFLAWHIVITLGEMGEKAGLKVIAPSEHSSIPINASDIVAAYEKAGASVESEVKEKWNEHQIHHRAQMTVLMRQAGLHVPGVYGPSREEWLQFGMPAPQ